MYRGRIAKKNQRFLGRTRKLGFRFHPPKRKRAAAKLSKHFFPLLSARSPSCFYSCHARGVRHGLRHLLHMRVSVHVQQDCQRRKPNRLPFALDLHDCPILSRETRRERAEADTPGLEHCCVHIKYSGLWDAAGLVCLGSWKPANWFSKLPEALQ